MAPRSRPRSGLKFPIYSDEVLDRIIEARGGLPEDDREVEVLTGIEPTGKALYKRARRREALRACLEGAAEHYTCFYSGGLGPTQAMLAKRYAEIERAGQQFLEGLGKPAKAPSKPDSITRIVRAELGMELAGGVPSLEALAGMRVQETIRDVEKLLRRVTRLREKSAGVEQTASTKKDVALNELIRWLGHAYLLVFEEAPGSSVKDGIVQGPFIHFVRAALEPLLEEVPSSAALRRRIRDHLPSLLGMAKSQKFQN
jgi:hypothetical protein